MKVLGIVIILIGFIIIYVGVTGSQHSLMAAITGSNSPTTSGLKINPSGTASGLTVASANTPSNNSPPGTVQAV